MAAHGTGPIYGHSPTILWNSNTRYWCALMTNVTSNINATFGGCIQQMGYSPGRTVNEGPGAIIQMV